MLNLQIRVSKKLTYLMAALYSMTGIMIMLSLPFSFQLKALVLLLHSIHGYIIWYRILSLQAQTAISVLQYTDHRQWLLTDRQQNIYTGTLQRGSVCTRHFAILNFRLTPSQQYRPIIIASDSLSEEDFRRLRQRLRWGL